jgi:RND superfamily putative drug exporter
MALGVVLDAIAVRSLLVPALVALFGRLGMWPGNRRFKPPPARPEPEAEPATDPGRAVR